jgi:hypothetical protein
VNLLNVVVAGISIVSFIGLAFVYLRGSADKGTIESQARLIKAQGDEITDLTRRVTKAEGEVSTVKTENQVLRDAVSHIDEVRQLQTTLDTHHTESMEAWGDILTAIKSGSAA